MSSIYLYIYVFISICIVPPDIINEESSADIAVQEGEDAALTCRATGNPIPRVMWRREDGEVIFMKKPGSREMVRGEYTHTHTTALASAEENAPIYFVYYSFYKK